MGLLCIVTFAQPRNIELLPDSAKISFADSIIIQQTTKQHFPNKATMYSAVLPGLGQIYNKQVWKVPFIYTGFAALGYLINDYQKNYIGSKRAYIELMDKNPTTTYYKEFLAKHNYNEEINELNPSNNLDRKLIDYVESYSKQRDIFIIATAGFYLLNLLDANVSAHFIDFDISEDLTFNFNQISNDPISSIPIYGAILTYNF